MATPLHDPEVYRSLAEGPPSPAADWALSRLALQGEPVPRLPADPEALEAVLATGPGDLIGLLARTPLPSGAETGRGVARIGALGLVPADPQPLAELLRERLSGGRALPWLGVALQALGCITGPDLARIAPHAERIPWLLPALVLTLAEQTGEVEETAMALVQELGSRLDPETLFGTLAALGVPMDLPVGGAEDGATAAAAGATAAGGTLPVRVRPKGSKKLRLQRWIGALLDGVPGPAAALLRATSSSPDLAGGAIHVGLAAWLRTFAAGDPVDDVLLRHGGADPRRLSAARWATGPDRAEDIGSALAGGRAYVGVLALPLLDSPAGPRLAGALVDRAVSGQPLLGGSTGVVGVLARVAAARHPDLVPPLLADPRTRSVGLLLARWTPTMEVLEALLALPMPTDRSDRVHFGQALACMGDSAAVPALGDVVRDPGGDHAWARALAGSLLHVTL